MSLLATLFGDETRVTVLRLLLEQDDGRSQRWIAQRIGRAPSHVHRVIQTFDAIGLVSIGADRMVRLDTESPLHDFVRDTISWSQTLEGIGRYLRVVIRAANERFQDTRPYYVGGYVAATRVLQPIDFSSDRVDLYVKGLAPKDHEWRKGLLPIVPYDLRLHPTDVLKGYVEEDATIDGEPCLVAYPEVGAMQCLLDDSFPRYGAFLLLVQGLEEWGRGADGYQPQRLDAMASGTRWAGAGIRQLVDHVEGRRKDPPDHLSPPERRELANAIATVRGG